MRWWILAAALTSVSLVGCASRVERASMPPQERPAALTGLWEGVITGRELATSSHIHEQEATLYIEPDGSWIMDDAGELAVGRVTGRSDDTVTLEGRICTDGVGKGVRYRLQVAGSRFVAGSAQTHYAGRRVDTGIVLAARSLPAAPNPARPDGSTPTPVPGRCSLSADGEDDETEALPGQASPGLRDRALP